MTDEVLANPRLARIYDALDPDRSDLDAYAAMVEEFGVRSVLDVGSGTGTFACLLAGRGIDVVGVDPAPASLDVARSKPGAAAVRWVDGDATTLPPLAVDLATMTGNVAQVFLADDDFLTTLRGIGAALRPGGQLVFEARDPNREAWRQWNREATFSEHEIPGVGNVKVWCDLIEVCDELVSFRWSHVFADDGATLTSDSTLRFRSRDHIEALLRQEGFTVAGVRDAPDRPGWEFVFVASKSGRPKARRQRR